MTSPRVSPQLSVSSNNSSRIKQLEDEIANLTAKLGMFHPSNTFGIKATQKRIAELTADLGNLKVASGDTSEGVGKSFTPAPDAAPIFASLRLDTGRIGVSDLKLYSTPRIG